MAKGYLLASNFQGIHHKLHTVISYRNDRVDFIFFWNSLSLKRSEISYGKFDCMSTVKPLASLCFEYYSINGGFKNVSR